MDERPSAHAGFRYWAFITYSHRDTRWCEWLHRSLETYRLPRHLVGQRIGDLTIPKRIYPVFRDREELGSAADLGELIRTSLDRSRNLIVVCSPDAARSRWVNEEIRYFKSLGRAERIFCLIVDGEPYASEDPQSGLEECIPEALRQRDDGLGGEAVQPVEPLAADARPGGDGRKGALLKLLAGILGVGFDVLRRRDAERRVRFMVAISAGFGFLALMMGFLASFALKGQHQAIKAQSDLLMNGAMSQAVSGQAHQAVASLARAVALDSDNHTARARLVSLLTQRTFPLETGSFPVHAGRIAWAEANRTGDLLLTASSDGSLALFDLARKRLVGKKPSGEAIYQFADFSDDGHTVVVAGGRGDLSIFAVDGFGVMLEQNLNAQVLDVHIRDDLCLALILSRDNVLKLWRGPLRPQPRSALAPLERRANTTVLWVPTASIGAAAFNVGGGRVVAATAEGRVVVWNISATSNVELAQWRAHDGPVGKVVISPDGELVASAGQDGRLVIHDIGSDRALEELSLAGVGSVLKFSVDGRFLVAATTRGEALLWDRETRIHTPIEVHHEGTVSDAELLDGGAALITASWDGTARYSPLQARWPAREPIRHRASVYSLTVGPEGGEILTGGEDGILRQWRYFPSRFVFGEISLGEKTALVSHSRAVDLIAMASVGKRVSITVMRETGPFTKTLDFEHAVVGVEAAPDGDFVVVAESDGAIHIWDRVKAEIDRKIRLPVAVAGISLLPDRHRLLVLDPSGQMRIWDLNDGTPLTVRMSYPEGLLHTVVADHQQLLIAAGRDKKVRFWDLRSGLPYRADITLREPVNQLLFDEEKQRLYVVAANTVHVYANFPHWRKIGMFEHPQQVWSLATNPQDDTVVSGCLDGVARVWRIGNWDRPERELRHGNVVVSVGFSPEGAFLVTGTFDGGVYVWDFMRGMQVTDPVWHRDGVMWVGFDGGERRVASVSFDGQLRLTETSLHLAGPPPAWLPDFAERIGGWYYDAAGQLSSYGDRRGIDGVGRHGDDWSKWREMVSVQNFGERL